jgi:hypothetical protein
MRGVVWAMLCDRRSIRPGENRVRDARQLSRAFPYAILQLRSAARTLRLISVWDSPFPADFGMSPLSTNEAGGNGEIIFLRCDPHA